tara:strand:+ start:478 stop:714 length:237 start_codon:yes stop_codon:yes gene_type:complete
MKKKIKLIWQFSGTDPLKIAEHHLIHLNEYLLKENLIINNKGSELINEFSAINHIIIPEELLDKIKHDLKPHQAFIAE